MKSWVDRCCFDGRFGSCEARWSFLFGWVFSLRSRKAKSRFHSLWLDRILWLCTCFLFLVFPPCFLSFEWFRWHWFRSLDTTQWFCLLLLAFWGWLGKRHFLFRWTESSCQILSEARLIYFPWFIRLQRGNTFQFLAFTWPSKVRIQNTQTWSHPHFHPARQS